MQWQETGKKKKKKKKKGVKNGGICIFL